MLVMRTQHLIKVYSSKEKERLSESARSLYLILPQDTHLCGTTLQITIGMHPVDGTTHVLENRLIGK